jgi:hypothetical protein
VNVPALLSLIAAVLLLVEALRLNVAIGWLGLALLAGAFAYWFWTGTRGPRVG